MLDSKRMQEWIFRIEREAASKQFQNYLKLSKGGLSLTCEVVADNLNSKFRQIRREMSGKTFTPGKNGWKTGYFAGCEGRGWFRMLAAA